MCLGSAKGWAGAFLYNPKAKAALDKFYAREDTLSLGICNGCQLMVELDLINPELTRNVRTCCTMTLISLRSDIPRVDHPDEPAA